MLKLVTMGLLVASAIVMSGCTTKTFDKTLVQPFYDDSTVLKIHVDVDNTSFSWFKTQYRGLFRNNYLYSLALAASTAKDLGYSYFSIRGGKGEGEIEKVFRNKNAVTVEDKVEACMRGKGSFRIHHLSPFKIYTGCEAITLGRLTTREGIVVYHHAPILYFADLSKEPKNKYISFSVDDVLAYSEVKRVIEEFKPEFESDKKEFLERKKATDAYAKEHPEKVKR